jgi:hypothetical protein
LNSRAGADLDAVGSRAVGDLDRAGTSTGFQRNTCKGVGAATNGYSLGLPAGCITYVNYTSLVDRASES